jgi:hypothetical protein
MGRWMDASGNAASSTFRAGGAFSSSSKASLHRLADGALALRVDGAWTARFASGNTAADGPPDWLATRPGATLSIIRGGNAHAVFNPPNANCAAALHAEFFARSGKKCGGLDLPMTGGSGCALAGDSGYDGTVILAGADFVKDRCTRSFWPGLLR